MSKPARRTVPELRLRRLGELVKVLRDRAKLTQAEAAELIGVNRTTWVHMERGSSRPQLSNVRAVIEKLAATADESERLLALAAKPEEPAWKRPLAGRIPWAYSEYIDLEGRACSVESWELLIVHGLLQTERYARAHARDSLLDATEEQIEARVTARMRRQTAFAERHARLSVVMGEATLHYDVGGPDVRHEQLARLLDASHDPDITVQVMPFSIGAHPSMTASYTLLRFGEKDPAVGYLETPGGDFFLEEPADLEPLRKTFPHLKAAALTPTQSRELITHTIHDIERRAVPNGSPFALAQEQL